MNIVDVVLFLLKYIPFWAVPLMLISSHFAYLYWLKDYKKVAITWAIFVLFSLTSVMIYLLVGGPDKITHLFLQVIR